MQIPFNQEMEQHLLGSILIDKSAIYKIIDYIEVSDFYIEDHQKIYKAMLEDPEAIDLITLKNKTKKGKILAGLTNGVVTATNILEYAKIIKDNSIRRQLIKSNINNTKIIGDEEKEIETVLAEVQNSVLDVGLYKKHDDTSKTALLEVEQVQSLYEEKREMGQDLLGISCGFEKIDNAIDGLRPHHVWVVGAFTSYGKTMFALNIINSVISQGIPSAMISLEMSKVDMIARLIAIRTKLNSNTILKGLVDTEKLKQINDAKDFLRVAPLLLHTDYFQLEKIRYIIRKDYITNGTKVFVIDYLQNIRGEGKEYDMITKSVIELQALARELKITLILISQISNEAQSGRGAGAGFKGSGHIEAVADLAIRLRRDKDTEVIVDGKTMSPIEVKVQIAKNRHGITGSFDYSLYLESGTFREGFEPIPEELILDI